MYLMWSLEDNFQESVFLFQLSSGDPIQAARLGSKHLNLLDHLINPKH